MTRSLPVPLATTLTRYSNCKDLQESTQSSQNKAASLRLIGAGALRQPEDVSYAL